MRILLLLFSVILSFSCGGREKELFLEGKLSEEKGEKTKALYFYELSLRESPDYAPVVKRMGLLLAESRQSSATALFYLEKYDKNHKNDIQVQRELFRLYLTTGHEREALQILGEIRFSGKKEVLDFFESTYFCMIKTTKQKDYLKILETSPLALDPYYAPWVRSCATKI